MELSAVDKALQDLQSGYCLWVGAGIGMSLGFAAGSDVPGWGAVVRRLEEKAGIVSPAEVEHRFPDRIERCLRALRRLDFQRELRGEIVRPLAEALVKLAEANASRTPCLPAVVRRLAHLGTLANPVVNFNVETTTSRLIADPSGYANIRCFTPPLPGASTLLRAPGPYSYAFHRNVYHPHGALDDSGICVMAASEYESMQGTLGLQLAVHNAFESKLAIVGMSLDDAYLREQIRSFRRQIDTIYWFMSGVSSENRAWAWSNDVTIVEEKWPVFWDRVEALLPGPLKEERLHQTWLIMVQEAFHEAAGRSFTSRRTADRVRWAKDDGQPADAAIVDEWRWHARIQGEDGNIDMTPDQTRDPPKEGERALAAIRRGLDDAVRIDRFCRQVAERGTVFFAWDKGDKVPTMVRVKDAREFWSSREPAEKALRTKYGARQDSRMIVEVPWGAVAEAWRQGSASLVVHLDEAGEPGATPIDVRASLLPAKVDAINSW